MVNRNHIRKRRKQLGLTQQELARKCNCSTNTIGRVERGQLEPSSALTEAIAEALGVPVTILSTLQEMPPLADAPGGSGHLRAVLRLLGEMSAEEVATVGPLVQALARVPGSQEAPVADRPEQQSTEALAQLALPLDFDLVDVEELPEQWLGRFLPVIGRLAAGRGFDTTEAEAYPAGVAYRYLRFRGAPPNAFALAVEGQSMAPRFCHGDMVIVDPDQSVTAGTCTVLVDDGSGQCVARLKRLVLEGSTARLESLNSAYPSVSMPAGRIRACKIWRHLSLGRSQPVGSAGYRW